MCGPAIVEADGMVTDLKHAHVHLGEHPLRHRRPRARVTARAAHVLRVFLFIAVKIVENSRIGVPRRETPALQQAQSILTVENNT